MGHQHKQTLAVNVLQPFNKCYVIYFKMNKIMPVVMTHTV